MEFDFVIIGAGLSGLAAHHELQKKGYSVVTLEASSIPGGRVRTVEVGDGLADAGAQFFTFGYPCIVKLLRELGIKGHEASPLVSYIDKNKTYVLNSRNPLSPVLTGYLSLSAFFALARKFPYYKKLGKRISPEDPTALVAGKESAQGECEKNFSPELIRKIFVPYFSAFNYAAPSELSESLVTRALLHIVGGKSLMGLSGGLATLPIKLAEGKDIRFNTNVTAIENGVAKTSTGEFRGKHIIVATTASTAKKLLGHEFPESLNVPYKPSAHEAFLVKRTKRSGAYGTMILPERSADLNVITDEGAKAPGMAPVGFDVVGALRTSEGAGKENVDGLFEMMGVRKEDIVATTKTVWKEAIPVLRPGHFHAIREYRDSLSRNSSVLLAGDYLSTGCAEGAVESGQFIASLF